MARTYTKKSSAGTDHNEQQKPSYEQYVKDLEEKVAMYQAKELDLAENKDKGEEYEYVEEPEIVISPTEYIKVMSLLDYRLNLCTKERGQGNLYKFDKLFQTKRIIYADLINIMEVNRDFMEKGYFMILNPRVVRAHGFEDLYKNILTKEKIEKILSATDESVTIYASAGAEQKKVIEDIIISKLVENPTGVDLNLVDKISRISNINLIQKAEETRSLLHPVEKEEK